jgi:hypothetical protein
LNKSTADTSAKKKMTDFYIANLSYLQNRVTKIDKRPKTRYLDFGVTNGAAQTAGQ